MTCRLRACVVTWIARRYHLGGTCTYTYLLPNIPDGIVHFDSNGVYSVRWVVELAQDGLRETSARPGTIESLLLVVCQELAKAERQGSEHRASSASASASTSTSTSTLLTCSIPRWSCKVVVVLVSFLLGPISLMCRPIRGTNSPGRYV